ncbi:MAG: hypothetical protein ACRDPW_00085 [Mycobacteriales bacterium]
MGYALAITLLTVAWALYVTWLAARLRRLYTRCRAAEQALRLALTRRALVAGDTVAAHAACCGNGAVAVQLAASQALHAAADEREAAESDLTRALQAAIHTAVSDGQLSAERLRRVFDDVLTQNRRVEMARALYNDAVRDTCALRRSWQLRALRLAAHRTRPGYFDIDTTLTMSAEPITRSLPATRSLPTAMPLPAATS